jgi:hypothetical protein
VLEEGVEDVLLVLVGVGERVVDLLREVLEPLLVLLEQRDLDLEVARRGGFRTGRVLVD